MKNLIVSSCICLALIAVPCASHAGHSKAQKAGGILTTALLGAGVGILVGAAAAAISGSSSGSSIAAGAAAGLILGAVFAILDPATDGTREENAPPEGSPPPTASPAKPADQ
ncbi:MAG TPA: hypothetical protein P5146_13835 [Desulfomonilia bacterium]|nr:hypothetical protein [Deltaproteobacteria bacterium]HRR22461.1 hypothetical protein [Desulfomonilia bacterium]HRR70368.1 hypothetical protein [Desulfomonilia bacterium]HRT46216.1 hypothetical protein [Desulfomonilia bacterium]